VESSANKKKRLRVFAGPNGSGKSTFIEKFPIEPNIKLGIYINADEIEKSIYENGYLNLDKYNIHLNTKDIQDHFKVSKFSPLRLEDPKLYKKFRVDENKLLYENYKKRNSYVSSDIADFLRKKLVNLDLDFSFETVMSDIGKIEFLEESASCGFYNYLYFFCTDDVEININRVAIRVQQNGHSVEADKIRK
jgi:predicted ABC-type ATPase